MITESFCTIRELSEVPNGLRIQHHDGQTSLLRRDNERYARIGEILRNAYEMTVPWPVRIARSSDGILVNAWQAWAGRPFTVVDYAAADACVVYFLLHIPPKMVKHDHPDFMRLLETLMIAAAEKRDIFYFETPGERDYLDDVCLADDPCPAKPETGR
jgi:hypothetical protein